MLVDVAAAAAVGQALAPMDPSLQWILWSALFVAFMLAFSVGANDVSNSFGTSVGARVLTVTQACILATFFEVAGSALLGYKVCDTFRKNIYNVEDYRDDMRLLMLGSFACLLGSAVWNLLATAWKMPISGTHSIVGATIGFSLMLKGVESVKWWQLARIVVSWFASPLLAGCISSVIYVLISKTVISKVDPLANGLKALPLFYGATIFINVATIVFTAHEALGFSEGVTWYTGLFITLVIVGIVMSIVALLLVPRLRRQISDELLSLTLRPDSSASPVPPTILPKPVGLKPIRRAPQPPKRAPTTSLSSSEQTTCFDNTTFTDDQGKTRPQRKLSFDINQDTKSKDSTSKTEVDQLEEIDLGAPSSVSVSLDVPKSSPRPSTASSSSSPLPSGRIIRGERLEVFRLFSSLQILTACFASFAHGSNDVSNAVAPLIPIWNIYALGAEDVTRTTPTWILLFGGIGICTGLWAWGRAVMDTVGDGLAQLTPSKGFAIELGSAISVLCASQLGLPVSTTHCKIGSVVIVGLVSAKFCAKDSEFALAAANHLARKQSSPTNSHLDVIAPAGSPAAAGNSKQAEDDASRDTVDWRLFENIALTWIVTVPAAAFASAAVLFLIKDVAPIFGFDWKTG